jgi:hypothetical protein
VVLASLYQRNLGHLLKGFSFFSSHIYQMFHIISKTGTLSMAEVRNFVWQQPLDPLEQGFLPVLFGRPCRQPPLRIGRPSFEVAPLTAVSATIIWAITFSNGMPTAAGTANSN